MKAIKIFITICLLSVLLCSCGQKETKESETTAMKNKTGDSTVLNTTAQTTNIEDTETTIEYEDTEESLFTKAILKKASFKKCDELITTSYSQNELLKNIYYFCSLNVNTPLSYLDEKYPVECIRNLNKGSLAGGSMVYCIYKLKEGGRMIIYFYGGERRLAADYVFIVKDLLYKNDFKSIKKGDKIEDIEKIDSGFKTINSINKDYLFKKKSFHITKDGFVQINYKYSAEKKSDKIDLSKFCVESVKFYNKGERPSHPLELEEAVIPGYALTYDFLEEDYLLD